MISTAAATPSFEERLEEVEHLVTLVARKYALRACPVADMEQELRMALFLAWERFDPAKASWKTFAFNLLNYRAIDVCRARGDISRATGKQNKVRFVASTDESGHFGHHKIAIESREDQHADVDWADLKERVSGMGPETRMAFCLMEGMTMKAIGERFGVSESRVSQMMSSNYGVERIANLIDHPAYPSKQAICQALQNRHIWNKQSNPNDYGVTKMKVYTTGQVAKICKVAPRTVSKWFDSGRLKGYRIPGSQDRRIPRAHLIKFLREHGMPLGDLEDDSVVKVLVVSQDLAMIKELEGSFASAGALKMVIAASGFEAGIQAESFQPQCIVVDFTNGRVAAMQICQNLRKSEAFSGTIQIALLPNRAQSVSGVNETFKRPFDVRLLVERIRTLVGEA